MEESVSKRKIIELEHLLQQNKIYRLTYQGKSLRPKQALTYLDFTKHIAQLAPTIQSHYLNQLSHAQNKDITDVISNLFADILQKLKGLADCLERKQTPQQINHEITDICQVCQQQILKQKIYRVKESLTEKQGLAQDILKKIKQVEGDAEPFSFDQDNIFFKELKIALEKKQQVLDMCNKQSEDYILHIEDQLRELIKANEIFSSEKNGRQLEGDVKKGRLLKQSVISSLKVNIKGKFPVIIDQVMKILLMRQQQERLQKSKDISIQTVTIEHGNPKVNEMKKKITQMTKSNNQLTLQNEKLQEIINQKEVLIHILENQLNKLHSQFEKKTQELQRNFKDLQKNKNTEHNILKSRLDLLSQETSNNLKSIKSFHKLKDMVEQSTLSQTLVNPMIPILATEPNPSEMKQKSQKNLNSTLKGSRKLIFPTLTKLKLIDQSQLIHNSNYPNQDPQIDLVQEQIKGHNEPKHSIILPKLQNHVFNKNGLTSSLDKNKQINNQKILDDQIQLNAKYEVNQNLKAIQRTQIIKNVKTERYTQGTIFQNKKYNNKERGQTNNLQKGKSPKNKNKKQIPDQTSLIKITKQKSSEYGQIITKKVLQGINTQRSHKNMLKSINKQKNENKYEKENNRVHANAEQKNIYIKKDIVIHHNNQQLQPNRKSQIQSNDFQQITEQYEKQNFSTPAKRESENVTPSKFSLQFKTSLKEELQKVYDLLHQQSTFNRISKNQFSKLFMISLDEMAKRSSESKASLSQEKKDNFDFNHQLEIWAVLNSQIVNREKIMAQQRHLKDMKILKQKLENHVELQNQEISVSAYASQRFPYEAHDNSKSIKQDHDKRITEPQQSFFADYSNLFANQEMAYRYQISFSKKTLKMPAITSELKIFAINLFERLEELKYFSNISYQQICSFMRYPFSNSKKGNLQIDIIQNISLIALTQCFQRIVGFHKKCKNQGGLCTHLINFYKQIESMVDTHQ